MVQVAQNNKNNGTVNLVIDIGNTRAKLLVFNDQEVVELAYSDSNTLKELDALCQRHTLEKGILSTVARLGEEAEERLRKLPFPLIRLDANTPLPINLLWKRPDLADPIRMPNTMGADRIAAIVGAMVQAPGTPLLIVDAGTCITYEVIDNEGFYIGGNIAPGIQMRLKAMHEHTALLPLVAEEGDTPLLGYDTDTCMRSGAKLGMTFEIEGYIRLWKERFPNLQVYMTGGSEIKFNQEIEGIVHHDNHLVPKGLNDILRLMK